MDEERIRRAGRLGEVTALEIWPVVWSMHTAREAS
jgi:hypothetical protein